jgi:hypothetical protein
MATIFGLYFQSTADASARRMAVIIFFMNGFMAYFLIFTVRLQNEALKAFDQKFYKLALLCLQS